MRATMLMALVGCATTTSPFDTSRAGEVLADFELLDTNPTSPTFDTMVTVADQRGSISAWYFGHSS